MLGGAVAGSSGIGPVFLPLTLWGATRGLIGADGGTPGRGRERVYIALAQDEVERHMLVEIRNFLTTY